MGGGFEPKGSGKAARVILCQKKKKKKTPLLVFQISDSIYAFPAKLERKQTQGSMTEKMLDLLERAKYLPLAGGGVCVCGTGRDPGQPSLPNSLSYQKA